MPAHDLLKRNGTSRGHPKQQKKRRLLETGLSHPAATSKRASADTELAGYLQEEPIDRNTDQLARWRDNQCRFPSFSKVAQKYMCAFLHLVRPVSNCVDLLHPVHEMML